MVIHTAMGRDFEQLFKSRLFALQRKLHKLNLEFNLINKKRKTYSTEWSFLQPFSFTRLSPEVFHYFSSASAEGAIVLQYCASKIKECWQQDSHLEDFKYCHRDEAINRVGKPCAGFTLCLVEFPAMEFFKLVYVKAEFWLQKTPWCWELRGSGSVASTPCCSLCSSS